MLIELSNGKHVLRDFDIAVAMKLPHTKFTMYPIPCSKKWMVLKGLLPLITTNGIVLINIRSKNACNDVLRCLKKSEIPYYFIDNVSTTSLLTHLKFTNENGFPNIILTTIDRHFDTLNSWQVSFVLHYDVPNDIRMYERWLCFCPWSITLYSVGDSCRANEITCMLQKRNLAIPEFLKEVSKKDDDKEDIELEGDGTGRSGSPVMKSWNTIPSPLQNVKRNFGAGIYQLYQTNWKRS